MGDGAVMVCVAVFTGRHVKLYAMTVGICLGWLITRATGFDTTDLAAATASEPALQLPEVTLPGLSIDPALLPLVGLLALTTLLDIMSATISLEKIEDAEWSRPFMPASERAVLGFGLGNMAASLLAATPLSASRSAVGLAFSTGATARVIGLLAGAMTASVAFFPKVTVLFTLVPSPVMGAILLYMATFMIVNGMGLIVSRRMSDRRMFAIGISIITGLSVISVPVEQFVPLRAQPVFSSPLNLSATVAILLNLLFRIGITRTATREIAPDADTFDAVRGFLERRGDVWGARRDLIAQATTAAARAADVLQESGFARGPIELVARFDEVRLYICLLYHGALPDVPKTGPEPEAVLGTKQEQTRFATYLLTRMGDGVTFDTESGRSRIALRFDH